MMHGPTATPYTCPLAWGTVGWADDGGTFYELGEGDGGDPNLLIRVTLFRGARPGSVKRGSGQGDQTEAAGQQLLSKIASTFVHIPPRGTRVLVAIPEPFGKSPGGSVILVSDNPNPALIGNLKDGETAIASPDGKARILFKKENDAVVLYTEDADGKSVMIYVGKDKIQIANGAASLTLDPTAGITLSTASGGGGLTMTPTGQTTLSGQLLSLYGQLVAIAGEVGLFLGKDCVPMPGVNNALLGASGVTGLPAVRVYISPT